MNAPLKAKSLSEHQPPTSGLARATEKLAAAGISTGDLTRKLLFSKNLQHVVNRIHASQTLDDLMLEVSRDICRVFSADRLFIYVFAEEEAELTSKLKSGQNEVKEIKFSLSVVNIPGYVAKSRKKLNIADVQNAEELKSNHPELSPPHEIEKLTGLRSRQMLCLPILDTSGELLGVSQLINNKLGQAFGAVEEDGLATICETLAIAIRNRKKEIELQTKTPRIRTRYDGLVADALISAEELKLASNSARRKAIDIETVLMTEFQVSSNSLGQSLARFFETSYEPYRMDRVISPELRKILKPDYIESAEWMPLEDGPEGLVILALDPSASGLQGWFRIFFPARKKSLIA